MNKRLTISFLLATTVCQAQSQLSAQDALVLASQNRPALVAAKLRVEEARATAKSVGALSPLELAVGASSRNDVGATDQDLALTQGIDLFGRQRSAQALGAAGVERALAVYRAEAIELQTEVLTAFAEAVAAKHQSEVAIELLTVAEGLFNATKRKFDEGKVAGLQVTRANIELERAKQASELRRADYAAAIKRLSGLIGAAADTLSVEPDASIEVLTSPTVDERPDLLELKAEVLIAEAEAKVASVSNRPEFSLQFVRSPWGTDRGHFVGRAQVTWAVFDHGRAKNESRAAKLRAEAARKQLLDATTRAKLELEATKIEIAARQARIQRYGAILGSARDLVAKSQKGFSEGFGTQIDVLEATRALREVEQELVEARQQLSVAVIDQYKASGFLVEVLR